MNVNSTSQTNSSVNETTSSETLVNSPIPTDSQQAAGSLNSALWSQIKQNIIGRNKDNSFVQSWIESINYLDTVKNQQNSKIILGVPSNLNRYFVLENLIEQIYSEISCNFKQPFEVDLIVNSHNSATNSEKSVDKSLDNGDNRGAEFSASRKDAVTPSGDASSFVKKPFSGGSVGHNSLNADYTFNTFVVGRNSEFAHAASFNVSRNPGADGYNPLFICGPVGMGKTHLLHSVGNQIKALFPQLKITYISAETFMNECISSIRRQEMDKFRLKYRETSDVFLVDDVQFLARGEAVQEEFFHTINTLMERKKQVVVASDRMPKDITGMEDRIRSRLEWGIIADITMPDIETRVAILRYKIEKFGLKSLSEEVVNHIAKISRQSIRELEGNLRKLKMFSELQGVAIDLDLAKKVLAKHDVQAHISIEEIQKMVGEHYKVRISDLKSSTRSKQIVVPRQVAMYLIKKHLDKSLMDIGRAFGGKDHTTVINALSRVELLQLKDLDLKNDIEELNTRIHNITGV